MFPWMNPWFEMFNAPLSGNVSQAISPVTSWFSPQLDFNFAGNNKIEADVVAEVASYGKQLGILSEALIDLAEGKQGDALAELKNIVEEVDKVKARYKETLEAKAKLALDELKKEDPKILNEIIQDYMMEAISN